MANIVLEGQKLESASRRHSTRTRTLRLIPGTYNVCSKLTTKVVTSKYGLVSVSMRLISSCWTAGVNNQRPLYTRDQKQYNLSAAARLLRLLGKCILHSGVHLKFEETNWVDVNP